MHRLPRVVLAAFAGLFVPLVLPAQHVCGPSPFPAELPAVDQVIDSAAAVSLFAAIGEGSREYSILRERDTPVRILPVDDGVAVPGPARDLFVDSVAPFLRKSSNPAFVWAVRLHATGGATPTVRLARSTMCPARRIPDDTRRTIRLTRTGPANTGMPPRLNLQRETLVLQVIISATGKVTGVNRIGGNAPVRGELEEQFVPIVSEVRYFPARVDGVAVVSADTSRFPGSRR